MKNADYERVAKMARASGVPLSHCPTCLSTEIEIDENTHGREYGTYRYRGQEHDCDCEMQMLLRRHYLLAGIGDQYQRLNWADFRGSLDAKDAVALFLDKWPAFKLNGMGLEFSSPRLGVGKTFAATHVGKELIKRGESVFFIRFLTAVRALIEDRELEERIRNTHVLIIDNIDPAMSVAQGELFATKFEEIIRDRTDYNRVNIITTNMTQEAMHDAYPRTYSLLAAKQLRVTMGGEDARQSFIEKENFELVANGETRPIT